MAEHSWWIWAHESTMTMISPLTFRQLFVKPHNVIQCSLLVPRQTERPAFWKPFMARRIEGAETFLAESVLNEFHYQGCMSHFMPLQDWADQAKISHILLRLTWPFYSGVVDYRAFPPLNQLLFVTNLISQIYTSIHLISHVINIK